MNSNILYKNGYYINKEKYSDILDNIKKELTVSPYQNYNKKLNISFCIYNETNEHLIVPKYYGLNKIKDSYIDNIYNGDNIDITFNGILRDNQTEIINKIIPYIVKHNGGVLCLPCATGKTVLALYLISYFKIKTLIIVHKSFLLNQWKEKCKEFTNAKIGIIQQNKIEVDDKDIVIGMLQSIAKKKYNDDIFKNFGMVIFDEAHHAPSQYFSTALPIISAKITIGLSATPKRADKLEKILFWYFGNIMYQSQIQKNENVIINIINYTIDHAKFKEYRLRNGDFNRSLTISKISTIGRRNKQIVEIIENIVINPNRKIIILSDRIKHLELLKERFDKKNTATTDFYIGGMKQELLKKAELAQVIFASYSMASEGLDIPDLNTLIMCTPRKEVEQSIGRIIRKVQIDLPPLIYDFVDLLPSFINQGRYRLKLYNSLGFNVINDCKSEIYNNDTADVDFVD